MLPEEIEAIAKEANSYARAQIIEGSTQLQNNFYALSKQKALQQALKDIRSNFCKEDFFFEIRNTVLKFEQRIAVCKKLSIGNCYELGLMALDYMVRNHPEVSAEVYEIKGGDHAFLVVGRKQDSDAKDPMTWSDSAFICDPWSAAVYPATEYLKRTKNYYYTLDENGRTFNHTQDFIPGIHALVPSEGLSSEEILKDSSRLNTLLLKVFTTLNEKYCATFDLLIDDLIAAKNKLITKYGENDSKAQILQEKIEKIRIEVARMRSSFTEFSLAFKTATAGYRAHKDVNDRLVRDTTNQLNAVWKAATLSEDQQNSLNEYRGWNSLVNLILQFLQIKPTSSREYSQAIVKGREEIKEFNDMVNSTLKKT